MRIYEIFGARVRLSARAFEISKSMKLQLSNAVFTVSVRRLVVFLVNINQSPTPQKKAREKSFRGYSFVSFNLLKNDEFVEFVVQIGFRPQSIMYFFSQKVNIYNIMFMIIWSCVH